MGISVGEKALRAALVYGFLLLALRVLGKREISQQNTLDLLVILLVANAVQNGIIGNDNSVTGAVVGAAVLFGLHRLLGGLAYRYPWADRMLDGSPSYLIRDGELVDSTLKHEQISRPELRSLARRQGYELSEIGTAILETDGNVTFVRKGTPYDPADFPPTPARRRAPRPPQGEPA
ncbi:MAG: hypothetical protein QOC95_1226 [Thermoleophilaceae bacterium]|jgi:uncharacterized membrane protein YcaP (DUF421 family)|nr:hypothetical protein [Thermoleophilaceae bacterium]